MRQPDYNEKSKLAKDLADEIDKEALRLAREAICADLPETLKILKNHRNDDNPKVSLDACKEHLKLAGLYVERVDHSGSVSFEPFKVSRGEE